ncbi:MAG: DMT family transporter [Chloroflexota bacterium]
MSKRLGWILALLATAAYSTNAIIARGAILNGMHPVTLLAGRFLLASGLYVVTVSSFAAMRSDDPPSAVTRSLDRFSFWIATLSGVINGLTLVCFFVALRTVSASIFSMISITLVQFFTIGLLALGGESITVRKSLRLILGLIGLYFLVGLGGSADSFGLLLIVVGAILFTIHIVSVQWYLKAYDSWTVTTLIVVSATASTLLLWWLTDAGTFVPWPFGWLAIVFQGVITTFVGRILTYKSIAVIGSGQYALLAPLETSLTLLWAMIFLGERLMSIQWIGAVFILMGISLAIDIVWKSILGLRISTLLGNPLDSDGS